MRLRAPRRWVVWRYELRKDKWTKPPINPHTGRHALSTDASTWGILEDAVAAIREGKYSGMGFVLGGGYAGIDLDGCRDPVTGVITPGAQAIINRLDSYTELSPSGTGVKIFVRGVKPELCTNCRRRGSDFKQVEIYDEDRYFTVTGHRIGERADVEERTDQLAALCGELWGATNPTAAATSGGQAPAPEVIAPRGTNSGTAAASTRGLYDEDIVRIAGAATNAAKFNALWRGNTTGYDSPSQADLALASLLAFYAGPGGGAQVERLMLESGLKREKWTTNKKYLGRTIAAAFKGRTEFFTPRGTTCHASPQVDLSAFPLGAVDVLKMIGKKGGADGAGPAAGASGGEADVPAARTKASDDEDCDGGHVPLGARDRETGKLVLSPKRTLPTARAYVLEFHTHRDGFTLRCYGDMLWAWRGNRYVEIEDGAVRHKLQPWLHNALRFVKDRASGKMVLAPFESNPGTVRNALDSIRSLMHLDAATPMPCWLGDRAGRPPATEVLSCKSMNLHIPTGLVLPATPALFTPCALDFDYDKNAPVPAAWLAFLKQLWPNDDECIQLLQEWFGYCLIADTSQQKILLLVGPRRAGKGTIVRVLRKLLGEQNVAGPTTTSLGSNFGLQQLIGKSLAVLNDARFSGEHIGVLVERLLNISGEDSIDIDRKYKAPVTMKLPTRIVLVSNELPRLTDAANALSGRFLILRLTRSFFGEENTSLTEQLCAELPGILNWAIDGLKRLRARGYFVQPASSEEAIADLEDLSSPVAAFVREQCSVGPAHRVDVDELYGAFKRWCDREGRSVPPTKTSFGRDLSAAFANIRRRRSTGNLSFYEGIAYPAIYIPV